METRSVERKAGVPVLGRLPVMGHMFRHTLTSTRKSELVILLRPLVVQPNATWSADLQQTQQRLLQLGM